MEADSLSGNATSMISHNNEAPGFQVRSRAGRGGARSPGQSPSRFLKSDDFYINMKISKTMEEKPLGAREMAQWRKGLSSQLREPEFRS